MNSSEMFLYLHLKKLGDESDDVFPTFFHLDS